jgi:hypothetical protein
MVSDASPSTAALKMNEYFVHMAHMSYDRACAQDGYLKRPHLTIIDGDMRWDSGWFLVGFGVGGHLTRDLPQSDYSSSQILDCCCLAWLKPVHLIGLIN